MKTNTKTVLLSSILILPVLVFIFLKGCGANHYKLPVYFASDSVLHNGQYIITDAHIIPPFSFPSHTGNIFERDSLKGKIFVADFFFTRCPGICPKMTTQLTRVQEAYKDDKDIKILSFTVDPNYDNSDVLAAYAEEYNADSERWHFLTGSKDSLYTLAQKGFFISAMEDEENPIDFIHSEKLILVDKSGRIRGYYNGTDKEEVDRLIMEIKILMKEDIKNPH